MTELLTVERVEANQVRYETTDGNGFLSCHPSMADFVVDAWNRHQGRMFWIGHTPSGQEVVMRVIPAIDGVSIELQPSVSTHIVQAESPHARKTLMQMLLHDERSDPRKVHGELTYFKPNGKYHCTGHVVLTPCELHEAIAHVKALKDHHGLPGLRSGTWDGPIRVKFDHWEIDHLIV